MIYPAKPESEENDIDLSVMKAWYRQLIRQIEVRYLPLASPSQAWQEFHFNRRLLSPDSVAWPAQVMPVTVRHLGLSNPADPAENFDCHALYEKQTLERVGTPLLARAA